MFPDGSTDAETDTVEFVRRTVLGSNDEVAELELEPDDPPVDVPVAEIVPAASVTDVLCGLGLEVEDGLLSVLSVDPSTGIGAL